MSGPTWAEEEERRTAEEEGGGVLPPKQVEFDSNRGIKREICYRYNDAGDMMKDVREFRVETQRVSHAAAKRKQWRKFGAVKSDPPGPNPTNTNPGDDVFMKFVHDKELDDADDDEANKLKAKDAAIKCRVCGGAHYSHKCPYKDELALIKEITDKLEASTVAEEGDADGPKQQNIPELDMPRPSGRSAGAYIPPSLRGKGAGGADAPRRQDEGFTLRVSNLPEESRDQDLTELFSPFGRVQRIYLAKDKNTGYSKGFAFVTFVHREDADKALRGVNGFGYDHLILTVEWAKPSTNT